MVVYENLTWYSYSYSVQVHLPNIYLCVDYSIGLSIVREVKHGTST